MSRIKAFVCIVMVSFLLMGCTGGTATPVTPFFTPSPPSTVSEASTPNATTVPSPPNGLQPILLTPPTRSDQFPAWSPDGKHILFATYREDFLMDIYSMNLNGEVTAHLLRNASSLKGRLSWSPSGDQIAFLSETSYQIVYETDIASFPYFGVYIVPIDESASTPSEEEIEPLAILVDEEPLFVWDLAWSPDGSQLAITGAESGSQQIYLFNLDEGKLTQLTYDEADHWNLDWSPDGEQLVFTQGKAPTDRQVYVMNIDGSGKKRVSRVAGDYADPSWSPDGRYIVVVSNIVDPARPDCDYKCVRDLYLMDIEGRTTRLTFAPALYWDPSWSPDGNWILYNSRQDGHDGIYILDMSWLWP